MVATPLERQVIPEDKLWIKKMERQKGKERFIAWQEAIGYINAPAHAYTLLIVLGEMVQHLIDTLPDDPALAACHIRDQLPRCYGMVKSLDRWSYAVNEADPGDVPTTGARLCPS